MHKRNSTCCILMGLVIAMPFAFAQEQASISRLPPLPQPLDPILQDMFGKRRAMGGAVINLTLTTGHAPKFARASGAMAFAIRFETSTPRRLIELVIFRTAQIVGSDYELNQHRPLMKMCGYSDQQIVAVADWRRSTFFDDEQRAIVGYVEQMANGGNRWLRDQSRFRLQGNKERTHNPYPPRVCAFRAQADFGRAIRTPRLCEHRCLF